MTRIHASARIAKLKSDLTVVLEKNGHLTRENKEHKEKKHKEAGAKTTKEAMPEKAT